MNPKEGIKRPTFSPTLDQHDACNAVQNEADGTLLHGTTKSFRGSQIFPVT